MNQSNQSPDAAAAPPDAPDAGAIVVSRMFDAPRALVFKAWTEPERLMRWWAPAGCTTSHCSVDLRPGGSFHYCMHIPDGRDIWGVGLYREINEPSRIVYVDSFADAQGNPVPPTHYGMSPSHPAQTLVTVTFEEHAGRTRLTLRHDIPATVTERADTEQGWKEMVDRLAADLGELVITRVFNAPRELVWKAWTEADRLARWWGPKGFDMTVAKLDLRPGGDFHYAMRAPNGMEMWDKFVYGSITAPERMEFVSSFSDKDGGLVRNPMAAIWPLEVHNTLTLTEHNGRTTLTLRGGPVNATSAERAAFEAARAGMEQGFAGTWAQLDEFLTRDREIVMTRVYDAPRALVFRAWTDPQHIARWWGPDGFTTTVHAMDVQPGGIWRFTMRGPDGTDYPNKAVYLEAAAPDRLVYMHSADQEGDPDQFLVTVTFRALEGKTHLTMQMLFATAAQRDATVGFGAVALGEQTLAHLAELLLQIEP